MKGIFCSFIFYLATYAISGQSRNSIQDDSRNIQNINILDTITFDLSSISYSDGYILVPVYFSSDDTVYTIDFSLQFNYAALTYDSIIVQHPGVYQAANFNQGDSTLYFTSYCLQALPANTNIISVKLNLLSYPVTVSDFHNVLVYLNGDACSYKIIPPPLNVNVTDQAPFNSFVSVYPNPAQTTLNVIASEDAFIQLMNIQGTKLLGEINLEAGMCKQINTADFANGIYLLRVTGKNFASTHKVIIRK